MGFPFEFRGVVGGDHGNMANLGSTRYNRRVPKTPFLSLGGGRFFAQGYLHQDDLIILI